MPRPIAPIPNRQDTMLALRLSGFGGAQTGQQRLQFDKEKDQRAQLARAQAEQRALGRDEIAQQNLMLRGLELMQKQAALETDIGLKALKMQDAITAQRERLTMGLHMQELNIADPDYYAHLQQIADTYPNASATAEGRQFIAQAAQLAKDRQAPFKALIEAGIDPAQYTKRDPNGKFISFDHVQARRAADAATVQRMHALGAGASATLSPNGVTLHAKELPALDLHGFPMNAKAADRLERSGEAARKDLQDMISGAKPIRPGFDSLIPAMRTMTPEQLAYEMDRAVTTAQNSTAASLREEHASELRGRSGDIQMLKLKGKTLEAERVRLLNPVFAEDEARAHGVVLEDVMYPNSKEGMAKNLANQAKIDAYKAQRLSELDAELKSLPSETGTHTDIAPAPDGTAQPTPQKASTLQDKIRGGPAAPAPKPSTATAPTTQPGAVLVNRAAPNAAPPAPKKAGLDPVSAARRKELESTMTEKEKAAAAEPLSDAGLIRNDQFHSPEQVRDAMQSLKQYADPSFLNQRIEEIKKPKLDRAGGVFSSLADDVESEKQRVEGDNQWAFLPGIERKPAAPDLHEKAKSIAAKEYEDTATAFRVGLQSYGYNTAEELDAAQEHVMSGGDLFLDEESATPEVYIVGADGSKVPLRAAVQPAPVAGPQTAAQ